MSENIDKILNERGSRYGKFTGLSLIAQNIKSAMRHSPNWQRLPEDMKEALEMIATKMGRVLNGDPTHLDHWIDVTGYAQLVVDRLRGESR